MAGAQTRTVSWSPAVSPKTLPATINPSPTRLVAIPPTNNVSKVSPRSLEAILNSPRFPEGYHEPIWRILDATEKIKRFLRVGDEGIAGAEFVKGRGLMENELKGLWVQLEVIGEVIAGFTSDIESALANTKALMKLAQKNSMEDKSHDLPLLFELLNLDDMLKGLHHLPSYTISIHSSIIFHFSNIKVLLLDSISPTTRSANHDYPRGRVVSSGSSIHSQTYNIQPIELIEFITQHINTMHRIVQSSNTLLSLNHSINSQHTQLSWRLQNIVVEAIQKHSKPTRECLRNLVSALRVVRSVMFPVEDIGEGASRVEIARTKDEFYRSLLPQIRKAKAHLQLIDELGLNRNLDTDKDVVLPFYLELVRYTRGTVDESPLSKLGNERGLGVGYEGKSVIGDSAGAGTASGLIPSESGKQIGRRLSLSAESVLRASKGGFRSGIREWMRKDEAEEGKGKVGGFKGMWARWREGTPRPPVPASSSSSPTSLSPLASDDPKIPMSDGDPEKYNTLKRKHKSNNLSDSFLALSMSSPSTPDSKDQGSTDSLGTALSNITTTSTTKSGSGFGGNKDGKEWGRRRERLAISEDHMAAQIEWEEFAAIVNVQKCMCKTGWMVGGVQHLRGRERMGKGAMFGK